MYQMKKGNDTMKDRLVGLYEDYGCGMLLLGILLVLAIAFGVYCLEGWLLMLVWNYVAAVYFSAPILGYWAWVGIAVILTWLCGLLRPRSSK